MAKTLANLTAGLSVLAIALFFGMVFGVPKIASDEMTGNPQAVAASPALDELPETMTPQQAIERLGDTLPDLASARASLLDSAAQAPGDVQSLLSASHAYHDAIVQLRDKLSELEEVFGPVRVRQMLSMVMMYNSMQPGPRNNSGEITAELMRLGDAAREAEHLGPNADGELVPASDRRS